MAQFVGARAVRLGTSRDLVITGLLIMLLAIAVRDQLPRKRASSVAVLLLALLGVALLLAAFRVDTPMLRGVNPDTWHGWIGFLLIIATGVLAPLTMALAVRRDPGWRPITVVSVGQCRPAPPLQRWRRGSQGVR